MSKDFSFNLRFTGVFDDRIDGQYGHTGGFANLPECGITYGSLDKVKRASKIKAQAFIDLAIRNYKNREKQLIACRDGHVLVVSYDDGWFYSIAEESREYKYAGSCICGDDFAGTCSRRTVLRRSRMGEQTMTYINRDPFAREELHREVVTPRRGGCDCCGGLRRNNTLFEYRTETDGGRSNKHRGQFCGKSCHDSYHGR